MKDHKYNITHVAEGERGGKHSGLKKENNKYKKSEFKTTGVLFKGVSFSVGPHGTELYLKNKH